MAGLFDIKNASNAYGNTYDDPFLEAALKHKLQLGMNTNLRQSPVYTQGVTGINALNDMYTEAGFVQKDKPTTLHINPYSFADPINTTGHEAYHAQSNIYKDFLDKEGIKANILGFDTLIPKGTEGISGKEYKADFLKRIKNAYLQYGNEYKFGEGFTSNPHEFMANLQGIESTLPSGKTILDTKVGKDLFKTKEEKQMYLKSSLPGVMKALEYDPSLWEIAKDRADYAARVFKDKATASSYAKAAADAFKAFMSGPEAKVEYQDPFGDTTK